LGFKIFRNICQKFKFALLLRPHAKFGEDQMIHGRVNAYLGFLKWWPSAILNYKICTIFVKNSKYCLFLHPHAKFVKIKPPAVELLRVFDFQNGGRLPSWILKSSSSSSSFISLKQTS